MRKLIFLLLILIPVACCGQGTWNTRQDFDQGIQIVGGVTVSNVYISAGDTIVTIAGKDFILSDIRLKLDIADTASMLATYIDRSDTATMLLTYIDRSDTAAMLVPYINRSDTAAMLVPYINRSDTNAMLIPYALLSEIDHEDILNTHNLTTDITDHTIHNSGLRIGDSTSGSYNRFLDSLVVTATDTAIYTKAGHRVALGLSVPRGTGGVSNFLNLTDTPNNYTDDGYKLVRVNSDEDAIEFYPIPSVYEADYYLAPWGDDSDAGTFTKPFETLEQLWTVLGAGDLVYLRDGTYEYDDQQDLNGVNGTKADTIKIFAYPGEIPRFTKSGSYVTPGDWPRSLIYLRGDYIYWKGIEISYYTQATAVPWNAFVAYDSDHNIYKNFNIHHNGSGLRIGDLASDSNLVINGDFHHNEDPLTSYGDADGLSVKYTTDGTINFVEGCRMWNNSDDGIDLWQSDGFIQIENSWSWWNGYRLDSYVTAGDGNGFKLGGGAMTSDNDDTLRLVTNCIAFHNRDGGFINNGAECNMWIYNNFAYRNGILDGTTEAGFKFWNSPANTTFHVKNNISYENLDDYGIPNTTNVAYNDETLGYVTISDADFINIGDTLSLSDPRQLDGSLPDIDFGKLAYNSDAINEGTIDVGLYYHGMAPDLGAIETPITTNEGTESVEYTAATVTLTHNNCKNIIHVNADADAIQFDLPVAVPKLSTMLYDDAGGEITGHPNGTDIVKLNGVALDAGDKISSPGNSGDYIVLYCITAGEWVTMGQSGTWIDAGP